MQRTCLVLLLIAAFFSACQSKHEHLTNYSSDQLKTECITQNAYVHTSYLNIPNVGTFPCNGLVYFDDNEAIIFDTPVGDSAAIELINWIEQDLHCKIIAIVATHFHVDCLGSLSIFHDHDIPSYANELTIELAEKDSVITPMTGFTETLELKVGGEKIYSSFFGEGHTFDNIVAYIPEEELLFGGCLIKEMGAGNGNLADANVSTWSTTVQKIKAKYPNLKHVVPGHGVPGGIELLDYTIKLFEPK